MKKMKVYLMTAEQTDEHNDNSNEEHEQGNAVHAMHEFDVRIPRLIRISFADIEISEYLIPNIVFHLSKVTENY